MAINIDEVVIIPGIMLFRNYIIITKPNDRVAIEDYPLDTARISIRDPIKTLLGNVHLLMYLDTVETSVGRLFDCKYKPIISGVLHHSMMFTLNTRFNGEVYTDNLVSIHCNRDTLVVTLAPDVAMDGDTSKFEESD